MISSHEFIIIATDGLWEAISPTACLTIIHALSTRHSNEEICRVLVWIAKYRGSADNISIILIDLKHCSQTGQWSR